jgi:hypothetical protein
MTRPVPSNLRSVAEQTRRLMARIPVIEEVKALEGSSIFTATGALITLAWPLWFPEDKSFRSLPRIGALAELLALVELHFFCADGDRLSPDGAMDLMRDVTAASVKCVIQGSGWKGLGEAERRLLQAMPASPIRMQLSLHAFGSNNHDPPPLAALASFLGAAFEWLHEFAAINGGRMSASSGVCERLKSVMKTAFELRATRLQLPMIGSVSNVQHQDIARERSSLDEIAEGLTDDIAEGYWDGVIERLLETRRDPSWHRIAASQ